MDMEKMLEKIVTKLDSIETKQNSFEAKQNSFETKLDGIETKQNSFETKQDLLMAEVVGIKQYVHEYTATKDELRETENRLATHMDGFVKLHENLDTELVALRGKYDRLEERIEILERRVAIR